MKIYSGFPGRLYHRVPDWVQSGAVFHIRIGVDREKEQSPLTAPGLAELVLNSAQLYEDQQHWYLLIFLLMPDHLHMLVSFARDKAMSSVVSGWKRFHARHNGVRWQDGYFDHRLRDDERGEQLQAKADYILANPVVRGLCEKPEDWIHCIRASED